MTALYQDEENPDEQARNIRAVYFYVGQFLTKYQSIEDVLLGVFTRALMGPPERAELIFSEAKGLESKLKMISAAMIGWEPNISSAWDDLRSRIKISFDHRNQVAHSTGMIVGRGIVLQADEDSGNIKFAGYREPKSEFKLQKSTKAGEIRWNEAMLSQAKNDADTLFSNIVGLMQRLDGELVAKHLLRDWQCDAVKEWPTK